MDDFIIKVKMKLKLNNLKYPTCSTFKVKETEGGLTHLFLRSTRDHKTFTENNRKTMLPDHDGNYVLKKSIIFHFFLHLSQRYPSIYTRKSAQRKRIKNDSKTIRKNFRLNFNLLPP